MCAGIGDLASKRLRGRRCHHKLARGAALPCADWGCLCGELRDDYSFKTAQDYHERHPAVKALAKWRLKVGQPPPSVYQEVSPCGYRTRATLGVGPARRDAPEGSAVVGMFRKRGWNVVSSRGCAVNHPALDDAIAAVQSVLDEMRGIVEPFDHEAAETSNLTGPALRHVELSVERGTSLVQLVLIWNGQRGDHSPSLECLVDKLWEQVQSDGRSRRWHSIFVHWRDPDPFLKRAILSRRLDSWERRRPSVASGEPAETVETLDGLEFSFGPMNFQQANLSVYERILRDMKAAVRCLAPSLVSNSDRPLRLLELCGGVGAIGLSLAHAAAAARPIAGGLELLSTDVNASNAGPFEANARRVFTGFEPAPSISFQGLSSMDAVHGLLAGVGGIEPFPADILVLDPPRRGLAKDKKYLRQQGPASGEKEVAAMRRCESLRVIVYMSCGYDSFMADADQLTGRNPSSVGASWAKPFRLAALSCYDMFPFTSHIETLGIFVR